MTCYKVPIKSVGAWMIEEINRMVHNNSRTKLASRGVVYSTGIIVKEGSISIPLETSDLLDQYNYSFTL